MKACKYRFAIRDISDKTIWGTANSLFTIKRIAKHFSYKKAVLIINIRTNKETVWEYEHNKIVNKKKEGK